MHSVIIKQRLRCAADWYRRGGGVITKTLQAPVALVGEGPTHVEFLGGWGGQAAEGWCALWNSMNHSSYQSVRFICGICPGKTKLWLPCLWKPVIYFWRNCSCAEKIWNHANNNKASILSHQNVFIIVYINWGCYPIIAILSCLVSFVSLLVSESY